MDSPPSPAAVANIMSKVLDDDNLLREIILRVGFPTTLFRATLVCKRWFHHAADPAFLRRFRELHPPRLLGLYVKDVFFPYRPNVISRFVPLLTQTEEPDLATILRRMTTISLDTDAEIRIRECWNGSVFISEFRKYGPIIYQVHNPLFPERGVAVLPPPPQHAMTKHINGYIFTMSCFLSKGGDGCLSYEWLAMEIHFMGRRSIGEIFGKVYVLQDGAWVMRTEATTQLPEPQWKPQPLLVNDRIYMAGGTCNNILVLDLANSSFFTIQLPEGVELSIRYKEGIDTAFSRADASGVYLIGVKELQLRIWLYEDDNFFLVDTICLREMRAALGMPDVMVEEEHTDAVRISQAGDNAEFVFLQMGRCRFYLDIRRRVMRKVYEVTEKDQRAGQVHPFMMIWPPAFPSLKDDSTRNVV
ncbi:hypothetical protein BRADI_5g04650v3 [Brachypodium distachyon]|uniref:F-box protein AT5G49610-like beta-propeller domain-containing protein n=2 Tax=Brachypodium distachyon TaxID=15368 RepID=A0A0Q3E2W9_BRADI|nr:hypothetical protein BRADI_5g04650v3 [Brachypodium distachyon]